MSGQQSTPQQHGQVQLAGNRTSGISLSIGQISGNVILAQHATITRPTGSSARGSRSTPKTGNRNEKYYDSDSDSSSDSDAEAFFAKIGVPMPQKNVFRNKPQAVTNVANPANVRQMVIEGGRTTAHDYKGNPVQFNPALRQPNRALAPQNHRPPAQKQTGTALSLPPAYPCTTYERQTEEYLEEMKQLPLASSKPLSNEKIREISAQLGQGWRRVFRHLHVSDVEIDNVHQDSREVQESVYKLLMDWTKHCNAPSVSLLAEALVRADYVHVIQCLK